MVHDSGVDISAEHTWSLCKALHEYKSNIIDYHNSANEGTVNSTHLELKIILEMI